MGAHDDPAQRAPAVSSRLVRSPLGRPVAVEVTPPDVGLEVGYRFAVLGTEISMTSDRIQFTGEPSGRAPDGRRDPGRQEEQRTDADGGVRCRWAGGVESRGRKRGRNRLGYALFARSATSAGRSH